MFRKVAAGLRKGELKHVCLTRVELLLAPSSSNSLRLLTIIGFLTMMACQINSKKVDLQPVKIYGSIEVGNNLIHTYSSAAAISIPSARHQAIT
jgi:hypothetical protein